MGQPQMMMANGKPVNGVPNGVPVQAVPINQGANPNVVGYQTAPQTHMVNCITYF